MAAINRHLVIVVAIGCLASISKGEERGAYTEDEVRRDALRYVHVLLSPQTPSLADYYAFDGANSEKEYSAELAECNRRWPRNLGPGRAEARCADWLRERETRSQSEPSLYYARLRGALKLSGGPVVVVSVSKGAGERAPFVTVVNVGPERRVLEIHHAADRGMADTGRIWVAKVDGRAIENLLGGTTVQESE